MINLGAFGGAAAFFLWVLALRMTTPARVADTMTVNPIAASMLAAVLVGEPVGPTGVVTCRRRSRNPGRLNAGYLQKK